MPVIHKSPLPDIEIADVSITDYVLRKADELANKAAFIDGSSNRVVTFAELKDQIRRFAGGLASRGFTTGSTLALVAPNIPEYAVVFHGCGVAGGTVTTVNPTYGAEEIRFQLLDASASILVTTEAAMPVALEAIEGTGVEEIIVIGEHEDATPISDVLTADPIDQVAVDLSGHHMVLPYSSGTTGLPKGVMLTHRNLVANLCQIESAFPYSEESSGLAVLPFFHIYGMQVLMNGLLASGRTVISMPRFDLVRALELIQEHKITHFFAVPPMILALAKQPIIDNYDLSSLEMVMSGAAPLGAELAEEAATRIDCEVVQGYGMTELSPVSHMTPPGQYRPGSVGVTVPNSECRIVDPETGEDKEIGGEGELWVRGPMVMAGYLNNPEATAATIDEQGWLHTGDVAVIDEYEHIYIVDRVKELIKYKGFQVPPAELEAIIISHPSVATLPSSAFPMMRQGNSRKLSSPLNPKWKRKRQTYRITYQRK